MENEISLREIIEIIFKGKWLIISITAIIVIFAIIYSYVMVSPEYKANGTVIVNNINHPIGETLNEYVNGATSRDVFVEMIKSPEVLQKTIDELNVNNYTIASLQNNLKVTLPEQNENIINLSLQGEDREEIAAIINNIVVNAKVVIEERLNNYFETSANTYVGKMENEKKELGILLQDYADLGNSSNLPLLILLQQNSNGNAQFMIDANEQLLEELRSIDKATQVEYEQINEKINLSNEKYEQYFSSYKDTISASTLNIVDNRYSVTSKAFAPYKPVSPNKILNVAIAFVLGLMLSAFIVFIRVYWKTTSKEDQSDIFKVS